MYAISSSGDVSIGAAPKTILALLASATHRPKITQIKISCSSAPADAVVQFAIRRMTIDGTGSAGTVFAVDNGDGTPSCTSKYNYTIEGTYTAGYLDHISVNHRATVIVTFPLGAEPTCPIGAGNGIGIVALGTSADNWAVSAIWSE